MFGWLFKSPDKRPDSPKLRKPLPKVPDDYSFRYRRYRRDFIEQAVRTDADRELFLEYLTPFQQHQFVNKGWIPVQGSRGGIYFVSSRSMFDNKGYHYCVMPYNDILPSMDVIISKKLMIESDEEKFCSLANRTIGLSLR